MENLPLTDNIAIAVILYTTMLLGVVIAFVKWLVDRFMTALDKYNDALKEHSKNDANVSLTLQSVTDALKEIMDFIQENQSNRRRIL